MKKLLGLFVFYSLFLNVSAQVIIDAGRRGGGATPGPKVIEVNKATVKVPVLNVLFVGNHYCQYNSLTQLVQYMAAQVRKPINIKTGTLLATNADFSDHVKNPQTKKAFGSYKWDYVILQGHAESPLKDAEEFYKNGKILAEMTTKIGAKPLFFMTWPGPKEQDKTMEIFNAYKKLAIDTNSLMAPVGSAFQRAHKINPKLSFYLKDSSEPGPHGSYITAAVLTTILTRQAATGQKNTGLRSVTTSQGKALQKIAFQTVIDFDKHLKKIQASKKEKK